MIMKSYPSTLHKFKIGVKLPTLILKDPIMAETTQRSTPPKTRLANYLAKMAKEGIDPTKVDFNQITEGVRHQVKDMLSRFTEMTADAMQNLHAPTIALPALIEKIFLKKGYDNAVDTLEVFGLIPSGETVPDFERVFQVFSPKMLAIARSFHNPKLVLFNKGIPFDDFVSAIDSNKIMARQNDTCIDPDAFDNPADLAEDWKAFIVEASTNMPYLPFDNADDALEYRLDAFINYNKARNGGVVQGMDRWRYILTMMDGLKKLQPIDSKLDRVNFPKSTILNEDCGGKFSNGSYLPGAHWCERRLEFTSIPIKYDSSFHFRRSLGGDVPNA